MIKLWDNLMVDADKDNYIVGELRSVNVKKDTEIVQEQRIFNPKYSIRLKTCCSTLWKRL